MDDEDTARHYKLTIQPPSPGQPWQARLERGPEVFEFDSPLDLVAWLEEATAGQTRPKGLR